nr:uncharacterized protein LOC119173519 isoform X1 [Rhipicephalus microplus]
MPPRKNIARRGSKSVTQGRCAGKPASCSTAQQLESSKLAAAIVVVEKLSDAVVGQKADAAAIEASEAKKRKLSDGASTAAAEEPEPTEVGDGAPSEEEEEDDGACEALFLDVEDDEGGSPAPSEEQRAEDDNRDSAADEEDSMPAETDKDAEGNVDGAAEEVGDEATPEDDGECADEGADNVNGEEYTEVDEEIVEEEAEESQDGEGAEESQHCEEEVGEHDGEVVEESQDPQEAVESRDGEEELVEEDGEGEEGAEGEAAENWEAAADGEVEYYEEGDGTQDAEWDEEMECVDADDAQVVDDVDDADGVGQECADGAEDLVMDDPAVHDETARDTHNYSAEEAALQADGTDDNEGNEATTEKGAAANEAIPSDDGAAAERTVEITQLSELCPSVLFEEPRTIAESLRDSIQRSVQLLIEQMLDAKERASGQVDKRVYGCSLCNIEIEEPDQFDSHVESPRHTKRLRWLYFMGFDKEIGKFHCRVCHVSMPGEDHLLGHLRSERHMFLSRTLNVHLDYTKHLLLQHFSKAKTESFLQLLQPPATGSQPTTDEGKDQAGADKQAGTSGANSTGSGQQNQASQELYCCDICETLVPTHGDELERHFKGRNHQANVEELFRQGKLKPGVDGLSSTLFGTVAFLAGAKGSKDDGRCAPSGAATSSSNKHQASRRGRETGMDRRGRRSRDHSRSDSRRHRSRSRDRRGHASSRDRTCRRGDHGHRAGRGRHSSSRDGASSKRPSDRSPSDGQHKDDAKGKSDPKGSGKPALEAKACNKDTPEGDLPEGSSQVGNGAEEVAAATSSAVEDTAHNAREDTVDNAKEDTTVVSGDGAASEAKGSSADVEAKIEPNTKSESTTKEQQEEKGTEDSKEGDFSDRSRPRRRSSRSRSRSRSRGRARTGLGSRSRPAVSVRDPKHDARRVSPLRRYVRRDSPPGRRRPDIHSESSRGSRRSRSRSRDRGPRVSSPGTYSCHTCNMVLHSRLEYVEHFASRTHRLALDTHAADLSSRKRSLFTTASLASKITAPISTPFSTSVSAPISSPVTSSFATPATVSTAGTVESIAKAFTRCFCRPWLAHGFVFAGSAWCFSQWTHRCPGGTPRRVHGTPEWWHWNSSKCKHSGGHPRDHDPAPAEAALNDCCPAAAAAAAAAAAGSIGWPDRRQHDGHTGWAASWGRLPVQRVLPFLRLAEEPAAVEAKSAL